MRRSHRADRPAQAITLAMHGISSPGANRPSAIMLQNSACPILVTRFCNIVRRIYALPEAGRYDSRKRASQQSCPPTRLVEFSTVHRSARCCGKRPAAVRISATWRSADRAGNRSRSHRANCPGAGLVDVVSLDDVARQSADQRRGEDDRRF